MIRADIIFHAETVARQEEEEEEEVEAAVAVSDTRVVQVEDPNTKGGAAFFDVEVNQDGCADSAANNGFSDALLPGNGFSDASLVSGLL